MDPKMYDDEPWARLARQAGFEPIHTESSARMAFRFAAQKISDLELELARERKSRPLIKHKKRGTTYEVLGAGKIQTDRPLTDYAEVTVYRSVDDGQVWVRPIDEINDPDRFEDVSSSDNMPEGDAIENVRAAWAEVKSLQNAQDPFNSGRYADHPSRGEYEGSDDVGARLLDEACERLEAAIDSLGAKPAKVVLQVSFNDMTKAQIDFLNDILASEPLPQNKGK